MRETDPERIRFFVFIVVRYLGLKCKVVGNTLSLFLLTTSCRGMTLEHRAQSEIYSRLVAGSGVIHKLTLLLFCLTI